MSFGLLSQHPRPKFSLFALHYSLESPLSSKWTLVDKRTNFVKSRQAEIFLLCTFEAVEMFQSRFVDTVNGMLHVIVKYYGSDLSRKLESGALGNICLATCYTLGMF
jgi:hypothetical protein